MRYRIFIVFLLLLFTVPAVAQTSTPVDISTEKVRIKGSLFYIHRVLKGQTLYSIARRYGVGVEDILKRNPQARSGLQVDDHLQIPVLGSGRPVSVPEPVNEVLAEPVAPAAQEVQPVQQVVLGMPPVVQKDAAQLLAQHEASLRNDSLPCQFIAPVVDSHQCGTYVYDPSKQRFNIALLLPLSSHYIVKEMPFDTLVDEAASRLQRSDNFVEFYAGVLMAVADMKDQGMSIDLSVHDVSETGDMDDLLSGGKLYNTDLILGPVYAQAIERVLPYAQRHSINLVSPLDPRAEHLLPSHPGLFQVSPSFVCQQVKLLTDLSPDDPVLFVYDSSGVEAALSDSYAELLSSFNDVTTFPYKVEKGSAMRDTLAGLLAADLPFRVVVASNNEALVTDFTSNLSSVYSNLKLKSPLTLYGQARWRNFENVDLEFFHAMNLRLVTPFFVDYKDTTVQEFVARYLADFKTEPSQFAFQGYDVAKYFLTALHHYGPHFENCISLLQVKLLQGNYNFRRITPGGGFINTSPSRIHYTPSYHILKE